MPKPLSQRERGLGEGRRRQQRKLRANVAAPGRGPFDVLTKRTAQGTGPVVKGLRAPRDSLCTM